MAIRAIIIDDEQPARQELSFLLRQLGWLEVVGEAETADEGLAVILALCPELVFLDIKLPGVNGLELAKEIAQLPDKPHVVFTTAYDSYAIAAFEVNALDYILKPYHEARVLKAAHKARVALDKGKAQVARPAKDRLPVRRDEKVYILPFEDISLAFADGRDILVGAKQAVYRSELSLQELEDKFATHNFFRCHRGYLINLDKIKEISPWFSGGYVLKLEGFAADVPVSRKQVKEFRLRVGI
ncbi:MAG: response regulator transcription factor [Selenomonadales bacterium]|nr:response regulator transcription factor [Selenomonadales bacterium]